MRRTRKQKIAFRNALFLLLILIVLLVILTLSWTNRSSGKLISGLIPSPQVNGVINTPFISAASTNLFLNGQPFKFTGANVFNLASLNGVNAGCGGQVNDLDNFLSKLPPNSVVRMWAFQSSMATNIQTKKIDWTGIDRIVEAANKNNIKLILVLGDQSGTCDGGVWKDQAWYESGYKEEFLDYVKLIVSRYKDSTTIAMWEPINEPESSNCTKGKGSGCYPNLTCNEATAAKALRGFFDTVGGEIKNIDKNHLVSSGVIGDGQCGAVFEDYKYLHESPGIDVASYHDYNRENQAMPGDIWNGLQKRLDQMKSIDKPLIVGEVGMLAMDNSNNCMNYSTRRDKFKAKMDAQFKAGIVGFLPWALTGGTSKICNFDLVDNDPTLTLLRDYSIPMDSKSQNNNTESNVTDTQPPTPPVLTITYSPQATLTWEPSIDNVGVVRYDIFRNDIYLNTTTETSFTDTDAAIGLSYSYHVKGKDAAGNNSGESNKVITTSPTLP